MAINPFARGGVKAPPEPQKKKPSGKQRDYLPIEGVAELAALVETQKAVEALIGPRKLAVEAAAWKALIEIGKRRGGKPETIYLADTMDTPDGSVDATVRFGGRRRAPWPVKADDLEMLQEHGISLERRVVKPATLRFNPVHVEGEKGEEMMAKLAAATAKLDLPEDLIIAEDEVIEYHATDQSLADCMKHGVDDIKALLQGVGIFNLAAFSVSDNDAALQSVRELIKREVFNEEEPAAEARAAAAAAAPAPRRRAKKDAS